MGDEIYVNLNLNKRIADFKTKENRKTAVEHDFKNFYNYQTTLKIPEGYSVDYLPKNVKISNEYISSDILYTLEENQINYQHSILLNTLKLDLEAQKKVNELIDQIEQGYKEVVVLKKI